VYFVKDTPGSRSMSAYSLLTNDEQTLMNKY